jgi:hypothetical protein
MVIWKYPITASVVTLSLPEGARVLHVHEQNGDPCLWAAVDPNAPRTERRFHAIPTGSPIAHTVAVEDQSDPTGYRVVGTAGRLGNVLKYLGTVHLGASLVFHIFEEVPW